MSAEEIVAGERMEGPYSARFPSAHRRDNRSASAPRPRLRLPAPLEALNDGPHEPDDDTWIGHLDADRSPRSIPDDPRSFIRSWPTSPLGHVDAMCSLAQPLLDRLDGSSQQQQRLTVVSERQAEHPAMDAGQFARAELAALRGRLLRGVAFMVQQQRRFGDQALNLLQQFTHRRRPSRHRVGTGDGRAALERPPPG